MGQTAVQKIFARAASVPSVEVGQTVRAAADVCSLVDLGWYMVIPVFSDLGVSPRYPDRITVHLDHKAPADNRESARMHANWRAWCREHGVTGLHDVGPGGGISHQVLVEQGYAAPGRLLVHQDSHANTCGAVGCVALAMGVDLVTDMALGWNWHRVPPTVRVRLEGERPSWLSALDIMQNVGASIGSLGALGAVIEFCGPVVDAMSIDDRMALCNRSRKFEAVSGFIAPDDLTLEYMAERARGSFEPLYSDPDADFEAEHVFDVSRMEPAVSEPPGWGDDTRLVSELSPLPIDQAFIGSCAGGRLEDIRVAAKMLRGRQVAAGVRLIVTPASHEVWTRAAEEGLWQELSEAGAIVTASTCGLCYGGLNGILDDGEVCVANSTENTPGRMGSRSAKIYLASSATVAASAAAGQLTDPRELA